MQNSRYKLFTPTHTRSAARLAVIIFLIAALFIMSACEQLEPGVTETDTMTVTTDSETDDLDDTDQVTDTDTSEPVTDTDTETRETETADTATDDETEDTELSDTDTDDETTSDTDAGEISSEPETTRETATAPASTTTRAPAATTTRAPTTTTTRAPTTTTTRAPTSTPSPPPSPTPSPSPSPTPAPQSDFPYRNHGTLFRNQYNTSSQVTEKDGIFIGTANTAQGVVFVRVNTSAIPANTRSKAIFLNSSGVPSYQYDILVRDRYVGLPLNMGNGQYDLRIVKNVGGTSYQVEMSQSFNVSLSSSLRPFTASSIATDFSSGSSSVQRANQLVSGHSTTDKKVEAVYTWIINNISYDRNLQQRVSSGEIYAYWPDPDRTMSSRKGICFDYAALMCAMLRSQGIPTRMVIGPVRTSSGDIEHAWNEVYFEGRGWVVIAEFRWKQVSGTDWVHFDTTFAAGGISPSDIQQYDYSRRNRVY